MRFHELQIWKKKIPEETTFNNIILQNNGSTITYITEIEVWINVDGSSVNICDIDNNPSYGATADNDAAIDTNRSSSAPINGGSQIQVNFNHINYDDIQSIVLYNPIPLSTTFPYDNNINFSINLDASNLFTFNNFTEISNNDIFRFDGPVNDNVDTSNNYDATSKIPSLENVTYIKANTNISIIRTLLDSLYIENVIQTDKLKPIGIKR